MLAPKPITEFTDSELADMVRESAYLSRTVMGGESRSSRFLLVLAVPYGADEGVTDLNGAFEAFFDLVQDDDYKERNIVVYDHETGEKFETTLESLEADDEDDDEDDDEECGTCVTCGAQCVSGGEGSVVCPVCDKTCSLCQERIESGQLTSLVAGDEVHTLCSDKYSQGDDEDDDQVLCECGREAHLCTYRDNPEGGHHDA